MPNQPSPPPITPHQMDILRAATAMAWADGQLEPDEIRLILDQLAQLFASGEEDQRSLKQSMREYLGQNIPLEEVIPNLETKADRKLVLSLGYQVIQASRRQPGEPMVNVDEAAAYQRLKRLLELPPDDVIDVEEEVIPDFEHHEEGSSLVQTLAAKLHQLITR
ncbi:hypothetical protein Pse7367_1321 [Thalassoporum mexicanum PCC 7367]|uniref:tellurite resistance TerB family protein n=1 Tax=Thalassoporum mexicanum TaxID=3457544 RepID=UPI00029FD535|nr:TerB family tellurite resistance protein [Pseudanabaena sp. PCC 7367]AFY69615.1 hypothetical protein Pse7367_1321 [Pseudanabaena sp. PCC 7367]